MHTGRPKHTRRAEKTGLGVEGRVTAAAANAVNPSAAERAEGMLQYSTVTGRDCMSRENTQMFSFSR